jgi:hypothetical protein
MIDHRMVTVLDVFDNALDGDLTANAVRKLSAAELSALDESLKAFHAVWDPPASPEGELRVCTTGLLAALSTDWFAPFPIPGDPLALRAVAALGLAEVARGDCCRAVRRAPLRAQRISRRSVRGAHQWLPLSGFGWKPHSWTYAREVLAERVESVAPYASLIRDAAIILVPDEGCHRRRVAVDRSGDGRDHG